MLALAEPDYGGRVDYPDTLARLGGLQTEAIRKQGADPETGRKLGWMFAQAGLSEIEVGVLGGQWRAELSENEWELEWQVLRQRPGGYTERGCPAGSGRRRTECLPIR